ncbi:MAG: ABC transporter permease, partial [Acidobacteria bacterium]|nr:ABC transporter permease [Acidobacteriota bacterium]
MPLRVLLTLLLPWLRHREKRAEMDIRRELSVHVELETQQNIRRGMSPEDAARAARATLGNAGIIREDVRALWRWRWLDQLRQDVRCGARTLARSPGFTAMSVATLALTIGATTAIFSALHGILLRPLPVEEPDRLVRILDIGYVGELVELRERARTLDVSAYVPPDDRTLTGLDEPLRVSVVPIAGDLPARLGRAPALGPGFHLDDERPGAAPAALLSDALWRQRFGADPAIVGRTLPLDGVAHEVRGVMPPDFDFPSAGVDLWVPMTVDTASPVGLWARTAFLVGRLRPGVSLEAATDEIRALGPQFAGLFPWRMPDDYGTRVSLRTWREDRLGEVRPMLLLLFAAVAAVWLIGAVNLTNLQQVRAAARRHELGLRAALGAGRARVVRQLLTESALVSLLGGAAGLAVAWAGVPALVALLPADVPRADGIRVDGVVLGFTAVVSLVTALAAGTLPALRAARAGEEAARSGSRGSVGATTGRGLDVFVTVETAAAVTLAIAAALLARSLASQLAVDVGLSSDRRVVAEVAPSAARHPDDTARLGFYTALEQRLRALPFVRTVGLSTVFEPFGAGFGFSVFTIEGRPNPA